jgi:hypothetical protein
MSANVSVSTLTTLRDNLITAYTQISSSPTSSYMLGDRQFSYSDRDEIWGEINRLNRLILLRTSSTDCRGRNRMNLQEWNPETP